MGKKEGRGKVGRRKRMEEGKEAKDRQRRGKRGNGRDRGKNESRAGR